MRTVKVFFLISLLILVTNRPSLSQEPTGDDSAAHSPYSFLSHSGLTGLIRLPNAEVTPNGDFRAGYFSSRNTDVRTEYGNATTYGMVFGMFPNLEFGFDVGNLHQKSDLTANAKYQFLQERGMTPSFAAGVFEASKFSTPNSFFAVLGKHFLSGRIALTGGFVRRSDIGTKPYGGIELALTPIFDAVGERDVDTINYGLRAHFRGASAMVEHRKTGWGFIAGFTAPLSNRLRERASDSDVLPISSDTKKFDNSQVANAVLAGLIDARLENVKVGVSDKQGGIIAVEYENRTYAHSELDALGEVLRILATHSPRSAGVFAVTVLRSSIPVITLSMGADDYRQFYMGNLDTKTFGDKINFNRGKRVSTADHQLYVAVGPRNYAKSDLFIRPSISTEIGTDNFVIAGGLDVRPELQTPLYKGVSSDVRATLSGIGPLRSRTNELDRYALSVATGTGDAFVRASAGRFPGKWDGGVIEGVISPINSSLQGRAIFGLLKENDGSNTKSTTLVGLIRHYVPTLDTSIYGGYGKYLFGDKGYTAGVSRRFGDTQLGVEYRNTDRDRIGLLTFSAPLGPNKIGGAPGVLRVRPPDFLDYDQRVGLNDPNFLGTTNATGNIVATGASIVDDLLDRDRLNKLYILRSLDRLRAAGPHQK